MLNDEVVRTFATQIERNSVAIRSLTKSNRLLRIGNVGLLAGLIFCLGEIYVYEKKNDERYYKHCRERNDNN